MSRYYRKPTWSERIDMNPEISHGLLAIFLFVVAVLSVLSFFSMAGVAGHFIDAFLAIIFGQVRYAFPLVLIIVAVLIIKDLEYEYRATHWLGSILFFLSFNGLVHLQKPVAEMIDLAVQGSGGGLVGLALAWPLGKYLGYWGGLAVLLGLFFVSLIFLFNTSLAQVVALNKKMFLLLGWVGRQIIAFFALFKEKDEVKFGIKGDYAKVETKEMARPREGDDREDDEERIFRHRTIVRREEDEDKEKTEEKKEKDDEKLLGEMPTVFETRGDYKFPGLDLLQTIKSKPTAGDIKSSAQTIKDTFSNFGIGVEMGEVQVGPTVTQYSLKPDNGVRLSSITALSDNLALSLAAHPIRIEAPIPGKSLVGIEVPNQKVAMVTLRELMESQEYKHRQHNMYLALGKDVAGKVWFADLPKMPHLLVAGQTGSGKTVCLNALILSMLFQNGPESLRFIMVDPKQVELTKYNGIPHLLTPVITEPAKVVNALTWLINEMQRRFTVLSQRGKQNFDAYNQVAEEKLPRIVFVVDEMAELMGRAAAEVEASIVRLAQMARAVGIHLIIATQRPSVEVITGLMKVNIPGRIAFSVRSVVDSRTILDCAGADKLLGRGDMLFLTAEIIKPKRLQGAFVSEEEVDNVVNFLKGDEPPVYDDSIVNKGAGVDGSTVNMFGGPGDDQDAMFEEAKKLVLESGKASASYLQRFLKVGYARAARLLDQLEEAGIVGPGEGAKPREVFSEHFRPEADEELSPKDQTMDAGGTVLDGEENNDPDMTEEIDEAGEEEPKDIKDITA